MAVRRIIGSHREPEAASQLVLSFPAAKKPRSVRKVSASENPARKLSVVGLFAGIGGIERGLHRSRHETTLLCELDQAAARVLRSRFPSIPIIPDVRDVDRLPPNTDLLAAGFPCQDLSQAGQTAGIDGARSGLVGEIFRILKSQPVPFVALENVPFMLQLGRGRALDVIISRLEQLGYRWAYRVVDSRAFGIPQRRERVYLLACMEDDPRDILLVDDAGEPEQIPREAVACGFYWTEGIRGLGWAVNAVPTLKGGSSIGIPSPPAILFPSGFIGKPDIRDCERLQGFPADWTKPAEEVTRTGHRWKLVGNAVTVEVAAWIGRRLAGPGKYDPSGDVAHLPGMPWPRAAWNVGRGRHAARVTQWPKCRLSLPLDEFLRFPVEPLSVKATAGFLSRAQSSSLHFPDGFLRAVENHLVRMRERLSVAV